MREGGREWNGFITHIQIHTGTVLSKVRRSEMSAEKCVTILQEVIPFFFRCNSTQFNPVQFTCCPPENKFNSLFLIKKKTRVCCVTLLCFICLFCLFSFLSFFLSFSLRFRPIFLFFPLHQSTPLSFPLCNTWFWILFAWGTCDVERRRRRT